MHNVKLGGKISEFRWLTEEAKWDNKKACVCENARSIINNN